MNTNIDIQKKSMILALKKSLGIVTTAAKEVGISRMTHYIWLKNDPEYLKEVEDVSDIALDFAESKLFESIDKGSDTATIFFLKTRGKKRGYVERQEITGAEGESLKIAITVLGNDTPILDEPKDEV